jgi:hypothetical protein
MKNVQKIQPGNEQNKMGPGRADGGWQSRTTAGPEGFTDLMGAKRVLSFCDISIQFRCKFLSSSKLHRPALNLPSTPGLLAANCH